WFSGRFRKAGSERWSSRGSRERSGGRAGGTGWMRASYETTCPESHERADGFTHALLVAWGVSYLERPEESSVREEIVHVTIDERSISTMGPFALIEPVSASADL